MEAISFAFIASSFVAGMLTFLAPCTLPLVPGYLGFISGVAPEDLENADTARLARRKIFLNGVFFIVGFTIIFVLFGTLAGLVGQGLAPFRIWFTRIGGVLVILFGLFMLGALKIPFLHSTKRLKMPKFLTVGKPSSSLIVGGAFAFGWTPCVGPILGSILLLASTQGSAFSGTIMLLVFSLGLAVPFLLVALAYSRATKYIEKISKYLKVVSIIGGVFLIALGILLVTNQFGILLEYGFRLLDVFNYDALLDLL